MTEKEAMVSTLEREHKTTARLLKEYPAAKADHVPAEKLRSAKDLVWTMACEQTIAAGIAENGKAEFDQLANAPATWEETLAGLEASNKKVTDAIRKMSEEDFYSMMDFFTGPGQMGKLPRSGVLWTLMYDYIHHRGQMTIYNRLVGAKVPSIYGPSADEPWM